MRKKKKNLSLLLMGYWTRYKMRANHKRIIKRDYEVVIGAEGRPMKLLMQEFQK